MAARIYLVEDNATIRQNLVEMLEDLTGARVSGWSDTAACASRWLAPTAGNPWDLAILDIFLKQGNGLSVLQACQQRRPDQKVVVLSNYATPATRERCKALGADAVFDKSNEIDALLEFCIALGPVINQAK